MFFVKSFNDKEELKELINKKLIQVTRSNKLFINVVYLIIRAELLTILYLFVFKAIFDCIL